METSSPSVKERISRLQSITKLNTEKDAKSVIETDYNNQSLTVEFERTTDLNDSRNGSPEVVITDSSHEKDTSVLNTSNSFESRKIHSNQRNSRRHSNVPECKIRSAEKPSSRNISIFVSRVHPNECKDNLVSHVRDICGNQSKVSIESLRSKHDSYCSYKITIENIPLRLNITSPKFWFPSLYVRKFFSKNN